MRSPHLIVSLAALVASSGLVAACGSSSHSGSAPTTVLASPGSSGAGVTGMTLTIKNFSFSPSTLTVSPGATVTVHNDDSATHTVTAVAPHQGAFTTGNVGPGGTVTFTAPTGPGSYAYICMIHQFMHGTLIVK